MKNILKIAIGIISLMLGLVGIIIPILPTTPFILLSVGCFSAMPKVKKGILSIPIVREYYESYTQKSGLKKRTVIWSLIFLWTTLTISAILINKLFSFILLPIVGIAVSVHIILVSRPKKRKEEISK